jgi:hypothetical protein
MLDLDLHTVLNGGSSAQQPDNCFVKTGQALSRLNFVVVYQTVSRTNKAAIAPQTNCTAAQRSRDPIGTYALCIPFLFMIITHSISQTCTAINNVDLRLETL